MGDLGVGPKPTPAATRPSYAPRPNKRRGRILRRRPTTTSQCGTAGDSSGGFAPEQHATRGLPTTTLGHSTTSRRPRVGATTGGGNTEHHSSTDSSPAGQMGGDNGHPGARSTELLQRDSSSHGIQRDPPERQADPRHDDGRTLLVGDNWTDPALICDARVAGPRLAPQHRGSGGSNEQPSRHQHTATAWPATSQGGSHPDETTQPQA